MFLHRLPEQRLRIGQVKARELRRFYRFLESQTYTHRAARTGSWSDPDTWAEGRIPGAGALVLVPSGHTVTVDRSLSDTPLKLLRVDGTLDFDTSRSSTVRVETIAVTHRGLLEIGTAERRVEADKSVEILFVDRGPRAAERDPYDVTGGLVATGRVRVFGAEKASFAVPGQALRKGLEEIPFATLPTGWRVGDSLLLPGTHRRQRQDEVVAIKEISLDESSVLLDRPLAFDHLGPTPETVPVGNLTRNVSLRSENPADVSRRGHVMFMHTLTGIEIDGAGFYELGRTRASLATTSPTVGRDGVLVPGSDGNTIGRYAAHFHVRRGAQRSMPPNTFRRAAIVGSPKFGLVNHGGHVVAEGNVTYDIDGTHFFSENGSEIGSFKDNLAVYSEGVEDLNLYSRMYTFEFGHNGHGFWVSGGGIEVVGNYAFGHRSYAYALFTRLNSEGGRNVFFLAENLTPEKRPIAGGRQSVPVSEVPLSASRNVAAASFAGLVVAGNQFSREAATGHGVADLYGVAAAAEEDVFSEIEKCTFWAMRGSAVRLEYTRKIALRDSEILNDGRSAGQGITVNPQAGDIHFSGLTIKGFVVGLKAPGWGRNVLADSVFDNKVDVRVENALRSGRVLRMENVEFLAAKRGGPGRGGYSIELALNKPGGRGDNRSTQSLLGTTFMYDEIRLDDKQLYFLEQDAGAVPFESGAVEALRGKTAAEIWQEYRLAVGGTLAPGDAVQPTDMRALVGGVASSPKRVRSFYAVDSGDPGVAAQVRPDVLMTNRRTNFAVGVLQVDGERFEHSVADLAEGWNVVRVPTSERNQHAVVFVDSTPPEFFLHERFPSEIHPDDLNHGILVLGWKRDWLGGVPLDTKVSRQFYDVEARDGVVELEFPIVDGLGNERLVSVSLKVTEEAQRRGGSIDHYVEEPGP